MENRYDSHASGEVLFDLKGITSPQPASISLDGSMQKAKMLFSRGEMASTLSLLRKILVERPDYRPALELLGRIHMNNKDFDDAVMVHSQLAHYHRDSKAFNALGVSHLMAGEHEPARMAFKSAVSLDPQNRTYLANLAKLLMMDEEWEQAAEYLERALANCGNAPRGQLSQLLDHCREQQGATFF